MPLAGQTALLWLATLICTFGWDLLHEHPAGGCADGRNDGFGMEEVALLQRTVQDEALNSHGRRLQNAVVEDNGQRLICSCNCARDHVFYNSSNTRRVGKYQLALMDQNDAYRVGDLLWHRGSPKHARWRADSIAILCNSAFRGTLMRDMLRSAVLVDNHAIAPSVSDQDLERMLSSRGEGRVGYAYASGETGPNNLTLPSTAEAWAGLRHVVGLRYRSLRSSPDDVLLVPLRLGDEPRWRLQDVEESLKLFLTPGRRVARAEVSGALHYPATSEVAARYYNDTSLKSNEQRLEQVVQKLKQHQLQVTLRSEPNADEDLLHILRSRYVLPITNGGGLQDVALKLRQLLRGPRFLSFLGMEGSGQDDLIPFVRKILKSVDAMALDAPVEHSTAVTFQGGQQLFNAFRAGHRQAFGLELLQMPANLIVQQEYPVLTGRQVSREYDVELLFRWLGDGDVTKRAVIKLDGDTGVEDRQLQHQLRTIQELGTPVLRLSLRELQSCPALVKKTLEFLAVFLLPSERDTDTEMVTADVCHSARGLQPNPAFQRSLHHVTGT